MTCPSNISDRYEEWVQLAIKITRDPANAREVVHEVILAISERQGPKIKKPRQYMSTAIYTAYFGKSGLWRRKQSTTAELKGYDSPIELDPVILYRERLDILARRLPTPYRELFEAHFEHGVPVESLSQCSGVPLSTTYRYLSEAKNSVVNGILETCIAC